MNFKKPKLLANLAVHGIETRLRTYLRKTSTAFSLLGGICVLVLIADSHQESTRAQRILRETTHNQEALRSLAWANLLIQRANSLTAEAVVKRDQRGVTAAKNVLDSIFNSEAGKILPQSVRKDIETLKSEIESLRINFDRNAYRTTQIARVIADTNKSGSILNSLESNQWFALLDSNKQFESEMTLNRQKTNFSSFLLIFLIAGSVLLDRARRRAESNFQKIEADIASLKMKTEAAEQSNRLKSEFLANVSHELRTPMHGILSFSKLGIERADGLTKEKITHYFTMINSSASRLMRLVTDLLDLAKLDAGKEIFSFANTKLEEIASAALQEQMSLIEGKNISAEIAISPGTRTIANVDSLRLSQVFANLISNAIKFSDHGSKISIRFREDAISLVCEIENRGVGIPVQELDSIFDKFVQSSRTKSGAGGTGLGLSICREIVTGHGGKIWAEALSGGTTRFSFSIPKRKNAEKGLVA